ncbi:metal ABC transporter permease [Leptotrichia sp. oral taxon 847]|uniref:metal ABC transporter permease n=1 Tax=Leptotrichia sp. oral taxon 847 TaxID=1785996 RepID=UPI0007684221|nr:metal ABC transporter permease [Leptotrichia sp. oral taxon 847]AMD95501.1 zinc ABC transporter permease [Leptotrichia sp. oral taxon 847]
MGIIHSLLNEHTFRIVALGCMLLGILCGVIGCFAVLDKKSLLGDTISHASLPGICLVFMIMNVKKTEYLLVGALITGILCVILIQLIQNHTKVKLDSALAFVLSVFFGLGLVFMSYLNRLPGSNKSGLTKFIFGQASTFTKRDIDIILFTGTLLLLVVILFWKEFKLVSFDADFLQTLGYPSKILNLVISILIVVTVIVGIQAVGIILISAMLISPAIAARQWTDKLSVMVALSGIFGGVAGFIGTVISITDSNLPTGPIVVIIMSIILIISLLFSYKRGILLKVIQRKRKSKILKKSMKEYKRSKKMEVK